MQLNVLERLSLLEVLPREGDFVTLKLVRKLRESLSFSEAEVKEIDFNQRWQCPKCQNQTTASSAPQCECGSYMVASGDLTWDAQRGAKVIKEIHLGEKMLALCESTIRKLSDEKKLTEQYMSLYEKFVEAEKEEE